MNEIAQAKLTMVSAENDRVRVRFTTERPAQVGDFLLPPDHPVLSALKVNSTYRIGVELVEEESDAS